MRFAVALLPVAVALVAPAARAQDLPTMVEDAAPPPPRPVAATRPATTTTAEPTRWYGWQILLADLGAYTLTGIALSTERPAAPAILGIGGYLVAPLVIHGLHRQGEGAGASLALRVLLPFPLAFMGFLLGHGGDNGSAQGLGSLNAGIGAEGAIIGAALGAFTASMIDAFGLAYEPAPQTPRAASFELGARPVRGGTVLVLGRAF